MLDARAPVFIGGTNGSGTRVYARLFDAGGVFQGAQKNYAFEPEAIIQYTRPLVPKLMAQAHAAIYRPETLPQAARDETRTWIGEFARQVRSEAPAGYARWGWKHPRNLYLLPFLNEVFPDCVFVHVIRDGRDMALAGNKADFLTLRGYLGNDYAATREGASAFWSDVNTEVADWAEDALGPRYVVARLEDLCNAPREETRRLMTRAGIAVDDTLAGQSREIVSPPGTLGRWRDLPDDVKSAVTAAAQKGLDRFGYGAG